MLVGLPGSGKSTWAREFVATHPRYRIVSTDAIRALLYGDEAIQGDWRQVWQGVMTEWRRGLGDMAQGTIDGIIYDATNAQRRQRRQVIATARGLGFCPIAIYWFDVPLSVAIARNQQRSRQVPSTVIERMDRQIQGAPPSLDEGADKLVRQTSVNGSGDVPLISSGMRHQLINLNDTEAT